MTPAAGSFEVLASSGWEDADLYIKCPECAWSKEAEEGNRTIRHLIAAASDHARTAHPMSVPAHTMGV